LISPVELELKVALIETRETGDARYFRRASFPHVGCADGRLLREPKKHRVST
jgi:hypothetical protein